MAGQDVVLVGAMVLALLPESNVDVPSCRSAVRYTRATRAVRSSPQRSPADLRLHRLPCDRLVTAHRQGISGGGGGSSVPGGGAPIPRRHPRRWQRQYC